jgi:hypothetical protein
MVEGGWEGEREREGEAGKRLGETEREGWGRG